ncbi:Thiol-disulfide isomerase and thioredoxins [Hahella chejuensis KCTC 2396]|uniref:Thiol-disulfide isomerase and thioredoxins n=1 Tax=Hahella chejuensis (strain KCTC 2396) TaxID=349521 RepID=Q2SKX7_HAHCH|nr:TlpA disulfide reductase family protein [Hahella chejuensis]ABC28697.1 Thiol-disulfide isomerase and thioredoxins [Hahella chejuensis KCTC 2396]
MIARQISSRLFQEVSNYPSSLRCVFFKALAAGLILILVTGCSEDKSDAPLENVVALADGGEINLEHLGGQWIILNFWAEWCGPCKVEIPELNEINRHPGVIVLGVDYDGHKGEALTKTIDKMGINFPVLQGDPTRHWKVEIPKVLPTTLLIHDGKVQREMIGAQTKSAILSVIPQ